MPNNSFNSFAYIEYIHEKNDQLKYFYFVYHLSYFAEMCCEIDSYLFSKLFLVFT